MSLGGPDAGPFGGVGRQTFDGKGNTEAAAAVSVDGNIAHANIKGTYVGTPNCTGSMTLVGTAGSQTFTNHVEFVIVHGGPSSEPSTLIQAASLPQSARNSFLANSSTGSAYPPIEASVLRYILVVLKVRGKGSMSSRQAHWQRRSMRPRPLNLNPFGRDGI